MLQLDSQRDPLVEILRLAYRRGFAIRQEQEQQQNICPHDPIIERVSTAERESTKKVELDNQ